MEKIPNISFNSSEGATDIEFLSLSEIFFRVAKNPTHNPKKLHRINFFALLIVTSGSGTHQVDLERYAIQKGSVLKIAKGQVHAFQEDLGYDGYLVIFTEEFVLKYFSTSTINFISQLYNYHISNPLVENSTFNDFFLKQVSEELQNIDSYAKKEIIAKMLELYLLKLERLAHSSNSDKLNKDYFAHFINFKNLVENDFSKTRNAKDYADRLSITPKHLNTIVKTVTLNTTKAFIDQYVILESKRAILSGSNSLKEVSYQMGFDEITNFSKFFKKHTGLSPKEYKSAL